LIQRTPPVFVDATGRRRRLVTVAGALLGLGLVTGIAVLVASVVTGSSPLPLPGLPASGQGLQREQTAPAAEQPSPAPSTPTRVPSGTPTIAPAASDPPTAPPASTATPSTGPSTRGNRPTTNPGNPGNPKPSRTK
jgi:hypothetical protein